MFKNVRNKISFIASFAFIFMFNPFTNSAFASCWETLEDEVAQCNAMFENDNAITMIVETLCIIGDLIVYVFCEIAAAL